MSYTLCKEIETTGCEFEDGSDTRNTEITFAFVKNDEKEKYEESLISNYENQDYSYQFDKIDVAKFSWYELKALKKALDVLENKRPYLFD